jgi:hypothetical protein
VAPGWHTHRVRLDAESVVVLEDFDNLLRAANAPCKVSREQVQLTRERNSREKT